MASFFISYRRGDSAGHTGRLNDALLQRFGPEAFFRDIEDIAPGADFPKVLDEALTRAGALLVVIGPSWATATNEKGLRLFDEGDFVRREVAAALLRTDVVVIPVLVNGATMPTPAQLPDDLKPLATKNAIELSETRWAYDVDRLGDVLEQRLGLPSRPEPGSAAPVALPTRSRPRRWVKVLAGAGAAVVLLVVVLSLIPDGDGSGDGSEDADAGDDAPAAKVVRTDPADPSGVATIEVDGLTWLATTDPPGAVSWEDADEYCNDLTVDGTTFRLPTADELAAVADLSNEDADGTLVLDHFDEDLGSIRLWTDVGDETSAELFDVPSAAVESVETASEDAEDVYALCVSG